MKVRALRGVCIGVGRDLLPPDTADVDPSTASFLVGIGAVERVIDPEPEAAKVVAPAATTSTPGTGKKEK